MLWKRVEEWIGLLRRSPASKSHDWSALANSLEEELEPLAKHLATVQTKLVGTTLPETVICHNDINPTNIMADDVDPVKGVPRNPKRPVVFIDLEYAFYNNPLFDIAHHFLDMGGMELDENLVPDREWQHEFMRTYLAQWTADHPESAVKSDDATIDSILSAVDNWKLAVHYFWAVWATAAAALAEQRTSDPPVDDDDFDFYDFGQLRLDRYLETRCSLGLKPTGVSSYSHNPAKWTTNV